MKTNLIDSLDTERAKVPRPTCNVTRATSTPLAVSASSIWAVKWRPGGGRGYRARVARKDGLVTLAIRVRIVAADIRRQGHVADAIESGKKIVHRGKVQKAVAELSPVEHFSFEFDSSRGRRKDKVLAYSNFLAGLDEGAPAIVASAGWVSRTSIRAVDSWRSRIVVRRA